jgi:hypothetical protein
MTMFIETSILLIRHAEKPGNPAQDALTDGPNLSKDGWKRAQAYVGYFQGFKAAPVDSSGKPKQLPIDYVFAAADDYPTSYRPRLTVSLFANSETAPRPFSSCVSDQNYSALVSELESDNYDGKNILLCWHHGKIIDLANALLTANGKRQMPNLGEGNCWPPAGAKWPPKVFGWLFQICCDSQGAPDVQWTRCLNEKLMPDDKHDPCKGGWKA